MDAFEAWLLRRVAPAVETGDVRVALLTELQAEFDAARDRPRAESHAEAVGDIVKMLEIPPEQAEARLTTPEAQPTVTRDLLIRWVVEAWLEGQRRGYQGNKG